MGYPAPTNWPWTLADLHGVWCGSCLCYIDPTRFLNSPIISPQRLEFSHVIQKEYVRSTFDGSIPSGWTVPAHRRCHQEHLENESRAVAASTRAALLGVNINMDLYARALHDRGLYFQSVLLKIKEAERVAKTGDFERLKTMTKNILASAAGVRLREMPRAISRLIWLTPESAGVQYQLANYYHNRGQFALAFEHYAIAERVFRTELLAAEDREATTMTKRMREAQLLGTRSEIIEAKAVVESNSYSMNTIRILAGWRLAESHPDEAYLYFEQIPETATESSWLYRAEKWFGIGWLMLQRERRMTPSTLKLLYGAQYVFCILDLHGIARPRPRFIKRKLPVYYTPAHVIMECMERSQFRLRVCEELRRDAILYSGLRDELFNHLAGRFTKPSE